MNKIFFNPNDLADLYCCCTEDLNKAIYKNTACGAWLKTDGKKVRVGSIVEGSDFEIEREITFPFSYLNWVNIISEIEEACAVAWEEANLGNKNEN